jgi:hypothetical protein
MPPWLSDALWPQHRWRVRHWQLYSDTEEVLLDAADHLTAIEDVVTLAISPIARCRCGSPDYRGATPA